MLRPFLAVLAITALLSGCAAPPAPPAPPAKPPAPDCGKLDDILHRLEKNARYAYTADAIDAEGKVHMWFINPKTRKWTQVHVYSNLRACIENKGSDWHWAVDR